MKKTTLKTTTSIASAAAITASLIAPSSITHAGEGQIEGIQISPGNLSPSAQGTNEYLAMQSILMLSTYPFFFNNWEQTPEALQSYHLGVLLGSSGNINYEPFSPESANFYQASLGAQGGAQSASTTFAYEVGLTGTDYSGGIQRDSNESFMYDLAAQARLQHTISNSATLYSHLYIHDGAHASLKESFIFPGVRPSDFTNWRFNTQLAFRTDGQSEHSEGIQHRTNFAWHGYNPSGSDGWASYRLNLDHEVDVITSPGEGWFGVVGLGMRDFDDAGDYSSDSLKIGVGRFGRFPCGMHYRVEAGVQQFNYDGSMIGDREEMYINGLIYGRLAESDVRLYVNHGVQQDFVNFGSSSFVDPIGTKAGLSIGFNVTDNIKMKTEFSAQRLRADVTSMSMGSLGFYSAGAGVIYQHDENTQITLDAGVHRVTYNTGGSSSTDVFGSITAGIRLRY